MKTLIGTRLAIATAIVAALLPLAGCTEPEPAPGPAAANANTAAPRTANGNSGVIQGQAPKAGDPGMAPIELKDTIEGRVIGILCHKENPNATPEQATACAKQKVAEGGALGVLADDGTIFINDKDVRTNNTQLQFFIGEIVTIQGQALGDAAPDAGWEGLKVKKFNMKLVRRKGAPAAGTERQMTDPKTKK